MNKKIDRLYNFPAHFKLYSYSRGIVKPRPKQMPYREAKELVKNYKPSVAYTNHIIERHSDGSQKEVNAVTYEQFIKPEKTNS